MSCRHELSSPLIQPLIAFSFNLFLLEQARPKALGKRKVRLFQEKNRERCRLDES